MVKIKLSNGGVAIVDDGDVPLVSRTKWSRTTGSDPRKREYAYGTSGEHPAKLMHRVIANCPADMLVDHWNGDGLNNTRKNLRVCTPAQNAANLPPRTGRYKGVFSVAKKRGGGFGARVMASGVVVAEVTGMKSEEEAARVYDDLALAYFGDFAWLNFPPEGRVQCRRVG